MLKRYVKEWRLETQTALLWFCILSYVVTSVILLS